MGILQAGLYPSLAAEANMFVFLVNCRFSFGSGPLSPFSFYLSSFITGLGNMERSVEIELRLPRVAFASQAGLSPDEDGFLECERLVF